MVIREVKEKQIKEIRRQVSYTGLLLKEEAGFVFGIKEKPQTKKSDLPAISAYLASRQKTAFEKLPAIKKARLEQRMKASAEYRRYEEIEKGEEQHEIYSSSIWETEERNPLAVVQGSKGTRPGEGPVPEMGEWSRRDAASAFTASEENPGIGQSMPEAAQKTGQMARAAAEQTAAIPAKAAADAAVGAASGGVSEAVRFGIRAVKKAAKAFSRSVKAKEEAKKEAVKNQGVVQSARIGGGEGSSSYASGISNLVMRIAAAAVAVGVMFVQAALLPVLSVLILAVVVIAALFSTIAAAVTVLSARGDISYLSWAVAIAEDDSHGYSQAARTGPDYDCSSLVWHALKDAGYEVGSSPFATGSMPSVLAEAGFEQLSYTGMDDLLPGDILWVHGNAAQHTEMYLGDGQLVGASGDLDGGLPGDQSGTGNEIRVGGFYDDGWMAVFRSTMAGLGEIEIPAEYEGYEIGTIYTCTPHYGTWSWVYNQGRVHAAWMEAGSVYSENVAMIGDKYLIACTDTFGNVGDWITFYFEDGTPIECIMADSKGSGDPNWTPWGHIHGNQVDVIEAETNLIINPGQPGCVESWGGHRVVSATNNGPYV